MVEGLEILDTMNSLKGFLVNNLDRPHPEKIQDQ